MPFEFPLPPPPRAHPHHSHQQHHHHTHTTTKYRESVIPLTASEAVTPSQKAQHAKGRPAPTPWAPMLSSPAVWAIVINNFAFHYAFYVVMNWLPTYFNR